MATYQYTSGLGNAASFQVSGKPFVTGGIDCRTPPDAVQVAFPNVTRWISISNPDFSNNNLKIAFSRHALTGSSTGHWFELVEASVRLEVKCTSIFLTGSANCSIMAGLTGVPPETITNNWTGSVGIG